MLTPGQDQAATTIASTPRYACSPQALPELGIPYYFISGNHDDWYLDDGGPDVVQAVCEKRDDFNYLGPVGAFRRYGKVLIEMAHPNEGGAYAFAD